MRISDWSSDVCSSDLLPIELLALRTALADADRKRDDAGWQLAIASHEDVDHIAGLQCRHAAGGIDDHDKILGGRSEEHTSELQSLMRISYAVFCLKKKKTKQHIKITISHQRRT